VEDARYRFFEAIARLLAPAHLRKLPAAYVHVYGALPFLLICYRA